MRDTQTVYIPASLPLPSPPSQKLPRLACARLMTLSATVTLLAVLMCAAPACARDEGLRRPSARRRAQEEAEALRDGVEEEAAAGGALASLPAVRIDLPGHVDKGRGEQGR